MANGDDLYTTLGVPRDATPSDIKRAFRAIAKECHPDVAGEDATKLDRFKRARAAYEILGDPAQRARYDRRGERRGNSPFYGGHWGQAGKPVSPGGTSRMSEPENGLDLEDIFMDFSSQGGPDFGFGGKQKTTVRTPAGQPPPRPRSPEPPRAPPPRSVGRDIALTVDVPAAIAARGGVVTVNYQRLMRGDDGRMLHRYEEIHELKIPPDTRHGETLRVEKAGDAGAGGGPYGDLVCDLRVLAPPPDPGPRMKLPNRPGEALPVDVGVVEAILGGRVEVATPSGTVRVTIPAGTSSGTRFRLKGRGEGGTDVVAEVRIVVPKELDEESRKLIERFAELNPTTPN